MSVRPFVPPLGPSCTTLAATDITSNGASLNMSAGSGATGSYELYFGYGTVSHASAVSPASYDNEVDVGALDVIGDYSSILTNLDASTTYYFQAFITNDSGGYNAGGELNFATPSNPRTISGLSSITGLSSIKF